MPIDPRIILGIQAPQFKVADPLESAHKSLALQALMGQQELQGLQVDEAKRSADANRRLTELFGRNPNATPEEVMAIDPGRGMKMRQDALSNAKTQEEINKLRLESGAKRAESFRNALSRVANQEDLDVLVRTNPIVAAEFKEQGITTPVYSPEFIRRNVLTADKFLDAVKPHITTVNDGQVTRFVDSNPWSNPNITQTTIQMQATPDAIMTDKRTREEGALNRGVTIRGQNMTDARARETLDRGRWSNNFTEGYQVNMDTGETRPITTNGQPVMKEPKLTEDQGKATAWLVQADNGYRNMVAAMKATKGSAAKPGLPDVVAGVPSFGVGESAANILRGAERQKFLQGASSVSEALLRAATGAGINESEAKQKIAEITPKVGDSDAVIKQKLEAIPLFIETLKVRAGPGAGKLSAIREAGAAQRSPGRAASGPITQRNVTVDF